MLTGSLSHSNLPSYSSEDDTVHNGLGLFTSINQSRKCFTDNPIGHSYEDKPSSEVPCFQVLSNWQSKLAITRMFNNHNK